VNVHLALSRFLFSLTTGRFRKEDEMELLGDRRDVFGIGRPIFLRDADAGGSGPSAGGAADANASSPPNEDGDETPQDEVDFDVWQAEWSPAQKKAFEAYESGLRSALQKERNAKGDLEKQLRNLSKNAEGQDELQKQLQAMADALRTAEEEARFFQEASDPAVRCTQPKLAWLAAKAEGLVKGEGKVDWDGLKKLYPSLFRDGTRIPEANAAESGGRPATISMDDLLRNG